MSPHVTGAMLRWRWFEVITTFATHGQMRYHVPREGDRHACFSAEKLARILADVHLFPRHLYWRSLA